MRMGGELCGGSILDEYTILTAGHCCENKTPEKLFIQVGITDSKYPEPTKQRVYAEAIYIHPEYNPKNLHNDICIIKTSKIKGNGAVGPVCLPKEGAHPPQGTMCWAAGWGRNENNMLQSKDSGSIMA